MDTEAHSLLDNPCSPIPTLPESACPPDVQRLEELLILPITFHVLLPLLVDLLLDLVEHVFTLQFEPVAIVVRPLAAAAPIEALMGECLCRE